VENKVKARYLHVFYEHSEHKEVRTFVTHVSCVETLESCKCESRRKFCELFRGC